MKSAIMAGFQASVAGVAGKVAFDGEATLIRNLLNVLHLPQTHLLLPARAMVFALLVLVNASVFRYMAHGMDGSESTMIANVLSTSSNFLCTAILGRVVFSEPLSWQWFVGASLMISGMYVVLSEQQLRTNKV
jgi:drug/metabolite transporter (DMT)-like permease